MVMGVQNIMRLSLKIAVQRMEYCQDVFSLAVAFAEISDRFPDSLSPYSRGWSRVYFYGNMHFIALLA